MKGIDKIGKVFWKTVLSIYLDDKKLITEENIDEENFHQQILWKNTLIQYKQNILFFPRLEKAWHRVYERHYQR